MVALILIPILALVPAKRTNHAKPPAKPAPKAAAKAASPARSDAKPTDESCRKAWIRGDLSYLKTRCADLRPANSPVATYWRLLLTDEPGELRKNLSATTLKEIEAEPRLLLLAGRYQFSRGEARELQDLVWLANKRKLKGPCIDTLGKLAAAKD